MYKDAIYYYTVMELVLGQSLTAKAKHMLFTILLSMFKFLKLLNCLYEVLKIIMH